MGTVKINLAGIEMTTVLGASMTENVISFKALYELKSFPKLQQCENNVVWTEGGPIKIVAEFCPKVLVGQEEGYVNILVSHDIGHSAILGSTFMRERNLMWAAHIRPERVEDVSEVMENEEHFQRVEKVGLLTTALLHGSLGIYGNTTPMQKRYPVIRQNASTPRHFKLWTLVKNKWRRCDQWWYEK